MSETGYSIQESPRAKRVRVKVSLYDGRVVVVGPPRLRPELRFPRSLHEKRAWIERAQRQVNEQRELVGTNGSAHRPDTVCTCGAVGEEWAVRYEVRGHSGAAQLPVEWRVPADPGRCGRPAAMSARPAALDEAQGARPSCPVAVGAERGARAACDARASCGPSAAAGGVALAT